MGGGVGGGVGELPVSRPCIVPPPSSTCPQCIQLLLLLLQVGEVAVHLATATYTTGHDYLVTGGAELGYARKTRKVSHKDDPDAA